MIPPIVPQYEPAKKPAFTAYQNLSEDRKYGTNWGYYPKKAKAVKNFYFFKSPTYYGFILDVPKNAFAKLKANKEAADDRQFFSEMMDTGAREEVKESET
jgi:hypothetical protein